MFFYLLQWGLFCPLALCWLLDRTCTASRQMVQEGKRNNDGNLSGSPTAPVHQLRLSRRRRCDGLNYLSGKELPLHQRQSISRHPRSTRWKAVLYPCLSIHFDKLDEEHIGRFIYLCEIAIAVYVYCLNEKSVRSARLLRPIKKAMFRLLGKPGF